MKRVERAGERGRARAAALLLGVSATACASGDRHPGPITAGEIETWAGTGVQGYDGDGHSKLESWFDQPMELAMRVDGSAIVIDWNNHLVRRVRADGILEKVIGTPLPGDWPCQDPTNPANCEVPLSGSVPAASLPLNHPMDVAFEPDGSFFLSAWHNHKIEHFDAGSSEVTVVAGLQKPGGDGDGGPASAARLFFPSSVVLQPDGGILLADEKNNRIRRIAPDATHTISTVAGALPGAGVTTDGVPANTAALALAPAAVSDGSANPPPGGALALAPDGTVYFTDTFHHCVRAISPGPNGTLDGVDATEETIVTIAGTCGTAGYSGDGGSPTAALLDQPFDVELGPDGFLYIADTKNNAVRSVDLGSNVILPVAGTGEPGFSGDGGPAIQARLRGPYGLAFDPKGSLFIVDTFNNRIRRVAR